MSILNPIQSINLLSNMLYSILDVVSIANADVLNHSNHSPTSGLKDK